MVLCCHPLQLFLTTSNSDCNTYTTADNQKKELVGLLYAYTIQTKRYATKYKDRVQSVRQTQLKFAIFSSKPSNDSFTRTVMSTALMFTAIFMKIHSWKEDKTQYLLTDFAAITAV